MKGLISMQLTGHRGMKVLPGDLRLRQPIVLPTSVGFRNAQLVQDFGVNHKWRTCDVGGGQPVRTTIVTAEEQRNITRTKLATHSTGRLAFFSFSSLDMHRARARFAAVTTVSVLGGPQVKQHADHGPPAFVPVVGLLAVQAPGLSVGGLRCRVARAAAELLVDDSRVHGYRAPSALPRELRPTLCPQLGLLGRRDGARELRRQHPELREPAPELPRELGVVRPPHAPQIHGSIATTPSIRNPSISIGYGPEARRMRNCRQQSFALDSRDKVGHVPTCTLQRSIGNFGGVAAPRACHKNRVPKGRVARVVPELVPKLVRL
mmetsp:Transcript_121835/g.389597  ORF Transcript_121835/g.389597 Transcript_121835/m.389597 type:complete len:320 (-) Transcript_121835:192-1151(-)